MKKALLIIDPQNDFIDAPYFKGSLAVNGAYQDMLNLIEHIENSKDITDIYVTLDSHDEYDIAHPAWWINEKNENPGPFTSITVTDVENGTWKASDPEMQEHSLFYVKELERLNKYSLTIWPVHCVMGTMGHKVNKELNNALLKWSNSFSDGKHKSINYIYKGTNPKTEHYSGLKAEVVLPNAKETELNIDLINHLNTYDIIEVAGEASSHCVANTTIDFLENIPKKDRSKVVLLKDCMSPVFGFEVVEKEAFEKIENLGATFEFAKKASPKNKM